MGNSRKVLLIIVLLYGAYSIGDGLYGMYIKNETDAKAVIVIGLIALVAVTAFLFYKIIKRKS